MECIDIIMATYNGGKFIGEQIESILKQTHKNWKLLIRDDGSSDDTLLVIERYVKLYPDKVFYIKDEMRGLGASQNFAAALKYSTSDYVMFSDQDDIWLPDKIQITMNRMKAVELAYGEQKPVLIHTDLTVVDCNLQTINSSFWKYQFIDPTTKSINRLLVQNNITGCTTMINRVLKELLNPIPKEAIMHDWWIALLASTLGVIDYVSVPTILYRQHGSNDIGAKEWNWRFITSKVLGVSKSKESLYFTQRQAEVLYDIYGYKMKTEISEVVKIYAELRNSNFIVKRVNLFKYGILKKGIIRNIGLLLMV